MRDLPCAGETPVPSFLPGFFFPDFFSSRNFSSRNFSSRNFSSQVFSSRPGFRHQFLITRSHARPGRTQQTRIFCGKALLLTSSGARVQESKEENGETPSLFKENYPPPRTYYSLIGCSPSAELTSRGRQSTSSHKIPLAHAQIICLPLRTQDVSAIL